METNWLEAIEEATKYLRPFSTGGQSTGIVLGTGLGALIEHIDVAHSIPYSDIPHFPAATAESHKGHLIFGNIGDASVIAMQGRLHYYEGYSQQEITFPIRVLRALGVTKLFLSNASGGINLSFKKGDLVLIDDHINLQPGNPLQGLNKPEYGTVFPDMSQPYDPALGELLRLQAAKQGIELKKGVYVSVMGPNLETRAEYRFLKIIGADIVGMSTVPEVIVASQIGLPCAAVSVVTDECDPENLRPVNISEIIELAGKADEKLSRLFAETIKYLSQQ